MKFDTNLRTQDKKTIGIVVFIGIVALFCWYMIRPAWIKLGDLDDKIEQAEATKQEYKMKSINLGSAEILYDKAVTDIEASTVDFYDVMDNSEIEKMGTSYILGYGLTPVDFTINIRDGSAVDETPYTYADITVNKSSPAEIEITVPEVTTTPSLFSGKSTMKNLDVQSLQSFYNQALVGVTSTIPSEVQCAKITIVIQGPKAKCQALIDDITKKPSIRVTGFSWTDADEIWYEDEDGNRTLLNSGEKELRLDLNFYMTDKPHFDHEEG